MKNNIFTASLLLILNSPPSFAQIRIDSTFPFQTDTAKQYSLYIPSGYNAATPHRVMLGLHPLNTAVWNSISWCDTMLNFAESNNLILVCPDGGPDGMIDDPIDTAFTSALLDSVQTWYNIDEQKMYVMGFSWGGKTTYTYGLSHSWQFGGFIPIGAAVNGTTEVTGIIQNANNKPFFLVHGESDSPNTRFYPIRTALIANGAIEKDTLMPGIGHTINFPNRNQILSMAFHWVDSVNCAQLIAGTNVVAAVPVYFTVYPTILTQQQIITIEFIMSEKNEVQIEIVNSNAQLIQTETYMADKGKNKIPVRTGKYAKGIYFVTVKCCGQILGTKNLIIK